MLQCEDWDIQFSSKEYRTIYRPISIYFNLNFIFAPYVSEMSKRIRLLTKKDLYIVLIVSESISTFLWYFIEVQ